MASKAMVQKIVLPYLKLSGSRYGLAEDVQFPEDCIKVLRCRPFQFDARICNKWSLNRVVLCGDAAHVFPPFGGQGIASGFRDAVSLSWRLALLCHSSTTDHERVLQCWYLERKQQLEGSLATTLRNGKMVNNYSPMANFLRDWALWTVQLVPNLRRWLQLGPRAYGPLRYKYLPGMAFMPELGGGGSFAQSFCVEVTDRGTQKQVKSSDDVIFALGKLKLFQVVVLIDDLNQVDEVQENLNGVNLTSHHVSCNEATIFVQRHAVTADSRRVIQSPPVFRTASARESNDSDLCRGRPFPHGYDETMMWRATGGQSPQYILLRPDRFVFAICNTQTQLLHALKELDQLFPC